MFDDSRVDVASGVSHKFNALKSQEQFLPTSNKPTTVLFSQPHGQCGIVHTLSGLPMNNLYSSGSVRREAKCNHMQVLNTFFPFKLQSAGSVSIWKYVLMLLQHQPPESSGCHMGGS
jgi:hypothetical protein